MKLFNKIALALLVVAALFSGKSQKLISIGENARSSASGSGAESGGSCG